MKRLFLLLFLFSCSEAPISPNNPPPVDPPVTPKKPDPVDVSVNPGDDVDLLPPALQPEAPYRERRRMDLDQLDATIRTVTGGIGWTETQGNTEVNLFEDLASTLGKPDYLTITNEDLEPTAMFQKFLDDAARSVCTELMQTDPVRAEEDRTFFVNAAITDSFASSPERIDENLRSLLLRFHGRKLERGAAELEPWIWLVRSAEHVTDDQAEVWRTVCVGLMTHPDFYTY